MVFILFILICTGFIIMMAAQFGSIFLRLRMRLIRNRTERIIRQLDDMIYNETNTIKRIFSKEDPYGEENWEK